MAPIADSTAFKDTERILPQHQAALTLLQERLSAPALAHLSWLDLACGRGQIILSLDRNLSNEARAKIDYWAYDLDKGFASDTRKTAEGLGFASLETRVGDLSDFDRVLPSGTLFDFITLTNTVHEIEPVRFAALLVKCVGRLTPTGCLFIYDMERVMPPELGAVPWSRDDIRGIVHKMLDILGASVYRPEVSQWNHHSCNGWSVQLERQHMPVSRKVATARIDDAVKGTCEVISDALRRRLAVCRASLETLTIHGAETVEEQGNKEQLLFEFWSLSRALEHRE